MRLKLYPDILQYRRIKNVAFFYEQKLNPNTQALRNSPLGSRTRTITRWLFCRYICDLYGFLNNRLFCKTRWSLVQPRLGSHDLKIAIFCEKDGYFFACVEFQVLDSKVVRLTLTMHARHH